MFDLEEFVGGNDGGRMGLVVVRGSARQILGRHHQMLGQQGRLRRGRQRHRGSGLGLAAVGQVEADAGDDAAVGDFAPTRVFHDVDAELNDVARTNLSWRALFGPFAQTLVVYESSIATFRVLREG